MKNLICFCILIFISFSLSRAQNSIEYKSPDMGVTKLLESPVNPSISLSPDKKYILLCNYDRYLKDSPSAKEEVLNLAGVEFAIVTNMPANTSYYSSIGYKFATADSTIYTFSGLPDNLQIVDYKWSYDSKFLGLALKEDLGISLWVIKLDSGKARKLYDGYLGFSLIDEKLFEWVPEENTIVFTALPVRDDISQIKDQSKPVIYENHANSVPHRTYQGLLKSEHDEHLFDYYATTQLKKIDLEGNVINIGAKRGILSFKPSPDGQYIKVHFVKRPYSYSYTVHRFPSEITIFNTKGDLVKKMDIAQVVRPIGKDGTYNVPRSFKWRYDKPATLTWVEAKDNGNPKVKATKRDALFSWEAPFTDAPKELHAIGLRYDKTYWINDTLAIIVEKWYSSREKNWLLFNPRTSGFIDTLAHFNSQSLHENPGSPMFYMDKSFSSLLYSDSCIFLSKNTANSMNEVVPVMEKKNIITKASTSIWTSKAPYFEHPVAIDGKGVTKNLLISRQSQTKPPNLVRLSLSEGKEETLTYNQDHLKILNEVLEQKELTYIRDDSITLQATMYYNRDSLRNNNLLGTIVYAYPIDFIDKSSASEVNSYPYYFESSLSIQKLLALSGYVVLDYASFPVIGSEANKPNDTYLEQIELNAKAIINAAEKTGIIDVNKVAIMGHSYGAFMVANLLTHSNMFKTGIAMSGAYNRSLTPFGFQREYRNYWEEQDLYHTMSPFQNAHKLNKPILLFHGDQDLNPGTHYEQSERYYAALKGLGKTVRFVSLPGESHVYKYLRSYQHIIWEIDNWLKKHFEEKKLTKSTNLSDEM